jgi:hypothetical protein
MRSFPKVRASRHARAASFLGQLMVPHMMTWNPRVREIEDLTYILHMFSDSIWIYISTEDLCPLEMGAATRYRYRQNKPQLNLLAPALWGSGDSELEGPGVCWKRILNSSSGLEGENKIHTIKFISTEVEIAQDVTTTNNHADTTYCIRLDFHADAYLVAIMSVQGKTSRKAEATVQQKCIAFQYDATAVNNNCTNTAIPWPHKRNKTKYPCQ